MSRRRILEVMLVLALAAAGAAWLRARPAHVPGLTILGVRPGMTQREAEAVLGTGQVLHDVGGVLTVGYGALSRPGTEPPPGSRWVRVVYTKERLTSDVSGSHLLRDGVDVVALGDPASAVVEALGPAEETSLPSWYVYPSEHNLQIAATQGRVEMLWMAWGEGPRKARPEPQPALELKPVTTPGWSIHGVQPGMTQAEVEAVLGPGRQVDLTHGRPTLAYGDFEGKTVWVDVFYEDDRASTLRGSHLYQDGKLVLGPGDPARTLFPGEPMRIPKDGGTWTLWDEPGVGVVEKDGRVTSVYLQPSRVDLE